MARKQQGINVVSKDGNYKFFIPRKGGKEMAFIKWLCSTAAQTHILKCFLDGVITSEVFTTFDNVHKQLEQQLLTLGIFEHKYHFRTGYEVFDNVTGQQVF